MDIADLKLIDAVATGGSFTAAAAQMRLSQPSVSARVAAVERALGADLFTRDTRGARLTPAGQRYLGYARRCLTLLEAGARAAAAEQNIPTWRVGVPASYAPAVAPDLIAAAAALGWPVTIRTGHSNTLTEELLDGRLDIAITTHGPAPHGLTRQHLLETPITALTTGHHDPANPRYALHGWDHAADAIITSLLGQGTPRAHISLVSPAATAITLALHHQHIAVVPKITAAPELATRTLRPINLGFPRFTSSLQWLYPTTVEQDGQQFTDAVANRRSTDTRPTTNPTVSVTPS